MNPRFRTFRLGAGMVLVALAGCGDTSEPRDSVVADSMLVDVLVDLHLADARAHTSETPEIGDSLRDLVYADHGMDSTVLAARIDELATTTGAVPALTEAVEKRLTDERYSSPIP